MPPSTLPRFVVVQAKIQMVAALGLGTPVAIVPSFSLCPTHLSNPYSCLAGLVLLTVPSHVFNNPLSNRLASILHLPSHPSVSSPATNQVTALSGIFCTAIGVAYALNFYHGYDEWLYLSIPGRLIVGGICLAVWVIAPEKMSPLLFAIMVWDGGCAAVGAYLIGDWRGRKPDRFVEGRKGE
jgi:hypothetical protein